MSQGFLDNLLESIGNKTKYKQVKLNQIKQFFTEQEETTRQKTPGITEYSCKLQVWQGD